MKNSLETSNSKIIFDFIDRLESGLYEDFDIPKNLSKEQRNILLKLNGLANSLKKQFKNTPTENDSKGNLDALAESENRYKILVENSPFCIHEIDLDGKVLSMNPSGLVMLGLKKESEVCGTAYLKYVDEPNKKKVEKLMKNAINGKNNTFEFTSHQGGTKTVLRSNFIPIWSKTNKSGTSKVVKVMGITQDITESVQIKEDLLKSKENLKIVIDNIEEVVYSIDIKNGNPKEEEIIYLSPKVEELLGYQVGEFIDDQRLWYSIIHPEDKDVVADKTKKMIDLKKSITRSYRLKHKQGNKFVWFEDKVSPKINSIGEVCGFIGSARDITDRKQTEQALKDSEEKYRAFFEKAPIGIGLSDRKGNLLTFNNAILKPGGYSRKDIEKLRNVEKLYYEKGTRERVINELYSKGFVDQQEVMFKKKDGSPYNTLLSLTPITLEGKPYIMALVQDISETKEAQEALTESEDRNKTIVENVQEAIVIFEDGTKQFIDFNQNAIDLFRYSAKELKKMTPAQLSPEYQPDGKPSSEAAEEKILKALKGKKQLFEWVHSDKNGREFPCEIHLTRVPYKDRFVVMGSVVDISERKKAEQERENLIKELDRFVYSASHDLSAPLKSILGLLNIIRLEPEKSQIHVYLDKMEQSINKLEDFIREIIQYSRNTRLELNIEKIEMKPFIKEILEDLRFSDRFGSIDFILDFKDLPEIETDPFRLKIILNNLLSNSIKFSKKMYEEKPYIKVVGRSNSDSKVIDVIDNGQGIDKQNLDKIFDMFYRGSHSASGSGLGLYIAKEAANNINGFLKVGSEYGKGSTFSFILKDPS